MPAISRTRPRFRFALVPAVFLAAAFALAVRAQTPEPPKKLTEPKVEPKAAPAAKELPGIKLPDGTFLWLGAGDGDDRVSLTPQELQKLHDQVEQLKKQLAAKKATPPSGVAVRARVEKRGEQLVAVLKLTCTFRTTAPQTAVALGGRKGFLVAASLDGNKLPILDTVDDGFAALVETAGDHTLALDLEAPITARGAKPEIGFEIGLPRAAITTLVLDPPGPDVKRVSLTTRTPDPMQPSRRVSALDVKQLAPRSGQEGGYPLGPVESLEVTWDPPAASAQAADQVQSAELDINVLLTEGVVETTAKIKLRGPAREWKVIAPATASVSADRAAGAADVGPAQPPTVSKPAGAKGTEWKIEFPTGSPASDWVITAVTRQPRPKVEDPKHRGPFPVGPFAVLDVLRQTGTVLVKAGPYTRFVFKHGPDLRRAEVPGPAEDDVSAAFFRLTTGPTGTTAVNAPLFTVEAWRLQGRVAVKPTYKLTLTEAGWKVRAEVRVFPIRTEIDTVAVEVPTDWRGLEASPAELVEGVQAGNYPDGFWASTAGQLGGGLRVPVTVRLAAGHKQPFDLVLTATVPLPPGANGAAIPLPRFPSTIDLETTVTATVPEGLEVRGETREWEGEHPAAWGNVLLAATGPTGKPTKAVTTVTGKADGGLARVLLAWQPHRPDLTADVRADVTVFDRQVVVKQEVKLRSPEGLPRPIRFRGPPAAAGVKATPVLEPVGPGEWSLAVPPDAKELTLKVEFAVSLRPGDDRGPWKVPVGLLWPAGATRVDTTARVWSNTVTGRTLANLSTGWRELPSEPVADRDALPALALAASGGEVPLVLESREAGEGSAVAAWVDRGLIQAWAADDGATRYRARFLLRRWLAPAVEVRLPGPLAGPTPEFFRDGQKVEAVPDTGTGDRVFRVPLPEPRPGRTVVIEVRYQLPAARRTNSAYHPPLLPSAAFAGPVRWQVTVPPGTLPLLTGGATAEFRWRWRGGTVAPGAAGSSDELDHWLRTGDEPGGGEASSASGESLTARQATPAVLNVYRVPRVGFVILCSVAVFVLILVLTRLPAAAVGPVVAVLAGVVGVLAVFFPHPAAQGAGACQPGLLAAGAVLLIQLAVTRYFRHRVTHLPGFSRTPPEATVVVPAPVPSSGRNRPPTAAVGSTGAAPVAPPGG
jgi:hypothetical protein